MICWTLLRLFQPDTFESPWIGVGFNSAAVGLAGVVATQSLHKAVAEAVAGLDPSDRKSAVKAATRGPIPQAPPVHAAALRVGRILLDQYDSRRKTVLAGYVFLALLLIGGAAFAVYESLDGHPHYAGWFRVMTLIFAVLLASMWNRARRLKRRVDMLLASAPTAVTRAGPR